MTIGIYCLKFDGTDKVYIGQSNNIEKRLYQHIYKLKNKTNSIKLQRAYEAFGAPTLEILIICSEDTLDMYENLTIKYYNAVDRGLNTYDESRGRRNHKGLEGDSNPCSKYTNELISKVFMHIINNPEHTLSQVSKIFNISTSTLGAITALTQHTWLKDKYPLEYNILTTRKGLSTKGYKYCAEALGIKYTPIISPTGEIFNVTNISEFARNNGLSKSNLCCVLNGSRKSHKGWKLCPLERL